MTGRSKGIGAIAAAECTRGIHCTTSLPRYLHTASHSVIPCLLPTPLIAAVLVPPHATYLIDRQLTLVCIHCCIMSPAHLLLHLLHCFLIHSSSDPPTHPLPGPFTHPCSYLLAPSLSPSLLHACSFSESTWAWSLYARTRYTLYLGFRVTKP